MHLRNRKFLNCLLEFFVFSVTLNGQFLCQIHAHDSEDGFCINNHTIVEDVNIKVTLSSRLHKFFHFTRLI